MSSFTRSDLAYMDAPSTHDREISIECGNCLAVFDITIAFGEEFWDVHHDDLPECCGDVDFGVIE